MNESKYILKKWRRTPKQPTREVYIITWNQGPHGISPKKLS
jgi:hypothetical protein